MKAVHIRVLTVGAALVIGAALLFAQGMHEHGGPMGFNFERMLGFYSDALDLTSAQQDQIKSIWEKEKPTIQPLMQQMHKNHAAMEALNSNGTFDEAKTRALATQNAQTMIELQVQHARVKSEMMQVLTADQKTKLQQIEAKHEARMEKHMGPPPPED